jgi:hypothetical protein
VKVWLDAEYNHTTRAKMNLVAFATLAEGESAPTAWWLDGDERVRGLLKDQLLKWRDQGVTFVAFNVVAEASSFIALGIDPTKCKWIDIQLEYKMLLNHDHKFMYGRQLIQGKVKTTKPPKRKWDRTEEDLRDDSSKPEKSLAACAFKLLGKEIDLAHKDKMRDLIISCPETWQPEDMKAVMDYCATDVEILPALLQKIVEHLSSHPIRHSNLHDEKYRLLRGEAAARAALIEKTGYPVREDWVRNFSAAVPAILNDICWEINAQFPEMKIFEWNKKRGAYTMKQAPLKAFIEASPFKDRWLKTDGGGHSLALEAWTRNYNFTHDYPVGNLPAQLIRFLKTKQNVNGFLPRGEETSTSRKSFFDYYGDDGRARCWLNPYGSQSSRFQPAATGFIPLKSAWMRSMIQPRPGFSICSIDYASEEFLLAALLSKDKAMFESYVSGDPYLDFGKKSKGVPEDGTKDSHPVERQRFKSTVLGVGYLMGAVSLADKIAQDTGLPCTEDEAQRLIDLYFGVYKDYAAWIMKVQHEYEERGYLALLDGWVMFGDNDNRRSVSNCPVQGAGACILRRAIKLAQEAGLRVIIPLHDALYIEYPSDKPEKVDLLANAMLQAFSHYFRKDPVVWERSQAIRLDIDVWGPDQTAGELVTPGGRKAKTQRLYIDPRGKAEFEKFKKYFTVTAEKGQDHASHSRRQNVGRPERDRQGNEARLQGRVLRDDQVAAVRQ